MTFSFDATTARRGAARAALGAGVVALLATTLGACSVVQKVRSAADAIEGNRHTVDVFTSKLQSGTAQPFEATYVTTGAAPATIVYAVQPPKGLAFTDTPSAAGTGVHLIVNAGGEYACTPPSGPGVPWTCQKLDAVSAADQNKLFELYTPSHWVGFLKGLSLAAGFAGDHVTSSTMTVNGFAMQCVDLVASGIPGTSTVCTTAQGILGYVKVATDSTSFEIKSYTSSPDASLFTVPAGARITTVTTPTTTPA